MMKEKDLIKISFVGDIMSKIQQNKAARDEKGQYHYERTFQDIEKQLKESDYLIGNLETPIAGEDLQYSYKAFSFNTPIEFAIAVKNAGFSLVTTANNHCMDRGIEGIERTIDALDEIGLSHIGTYKNQVARDTVYIKEIQGIRFAFISYTYGTNAHLNGVYLNDNNQYMVNLLKKQERASKNKKNIIIRGYKKICRILEIDQEEKFSFQKDKKYLQNFLNDIRLAKEKADYVIFCMHSGGQYNKKEDRYTKALSQFAINNGVDFVIGCHPHVVHSSRFMKENKFIAYSLGNFCCTPYTNSKQINDLPDYSIVCNLYFDKTTKELDKITFNIVKSILDADGYTHLEFVDNYIDKIENEELKEKVKKDCIAIANQFYKGKYQKIEKEYQIFNGKEQNERKIKDI